MTTNKGKKKEDKAKDKIKEIMKETHFSFSDKQADMFNDIVYPGKTDIFILFRSDRQTIWR